MSRTLIIHRRDLKNHPFVYKDSYRPPDDDRLIDVYGNPATPVSAPVDFPTILNVGENIVWAGKKYQITDISIDRTIAAFNLPDDTPDVRLDSNKQYKPVYPVFSYNISAKVVGKSLSSVPSVALKNLQMIIPVYSESSRSRLGDANPAVTLTKKPTKETMSQFSKFATTGERIFYAVVANDTIQVVPKTLCIVPDTIASQIKSLPLKTKCPQDSSKMTTATFCRAQNTTEVQGYTQGKMFYRKDAADTYTSSRLFTIRATSYTPDPKLPVSVERPDDGIPVQVEAEMADGTTQNVTIPIPVKDDTSTILEKGTVLVATLILAVILFITVSGKRSLVMNTVLIFAGIAGFVGWGISGSLYKDDTQVSKDVLRVGSPIVLGIGLILSIIVALVSRIDSFLWVSPYVLILLLVGIFGFIANITISTESSGGKYQSLGYTLSLLPKLAVLSILFMTNPMNNTLAMSNMIGYMDRTTSLSRNSMETGDLSRGIGELYNSSVINPPMITDTDVAKTLRHVVSKNIKIKREQGEEKTANDVAASIVNKDGDIRVYFEATKRVEGQEQSKIVGIKTQLDRDTDEFICKIPKKLSDDYVIKSSSNPYSYDDIVGVQTIPPFGPIIMIPILLLISMFFIIAQPLPQKDKEEKTIGEYVLEISITVIMLLSIIFAYTQNTISGVFSGVLVVALVLNNLLTYLL